jgi:hypothetical protein
MCVLKRLYTIAEKIIDKLWEEMVSGMSSEGMKGSKEINIW